MHCGGVTVQILVEMTVYEYDKSAKCTISLILCSSAISNIIWELPTWSVLNYQQHYEV